LTGGSAAMNARARRLLAMNAGEKRPARAGVIPWTIAKRVPVVVGKARKNQQIPSERLQRIEDSSELKIAACGRGRPLLHNDAVGHIDKRQTNGRRARCTAS